MSGLGLSEFQETTKPLLRIHQVRDLREEESRLTGMLQAPEYQTKGIDQAGTRRRLAGVRKQLDTDSPKAYAEIELDSAKKRSDTLLSKILAGMPTQAEMRRNPPGAVDKHANWEKRNKRAINEWRNIQYRLHASSTGADDSLSSERDIGNFERFRPDGGAYELEMSGAQIAGKDIHFPPGFTGNTRVMSDDEAAYIAKADPELRASMALLDNDQRVRVLDYVRSILDGKAPQAAAPAEPRVKKSAPGKKTRKPMSAEAKAALVDRLSAAKAAKKAASSN